MEILVQQYTTWIWWRPLRTAQPYVQPCHGLMPGSKLVTTRQWPPGRWQGGLALWDICLASRLTAKELDGLWPWATLVARGDSAAALPAAALLWHCSTSAPPYVNYCEIYVRKKAHKLAMQSPMPRSGSPTWPGTSAEVKLSHSHMWVWKSRCPTKGTAGVNRSRKHLEELLLSFQDLQPSQPASSRWQQSQPQPVVPPSVCTSVAASWRLQHLVSSCGPSSVGVSVW